MLFRRTNHGVVARSGSANLLFNRYLYRHLQTDSGRLISGVTFRLQMPVLWTCLKQISPMHSKSLTFPTIRAWHHQVAKGLNCLFGGVFLVGNFHKCVVQHAIESAFRVAIGVKKFDHRENVEGPSPLWACVKIPCIRVILVRHGSSSVEMPIHPTVQ